MTGRVYRIENNKLRFQYGAVIENKQIFLNLKGTFLFCVNKEEKCQEKVWKKGVEFEEGEKDLSSKGLFPRPDSSNLFYRLLSGTALKNLRS